MKLQCRDIVSLSIFNKDKIFVNGDFVRNEQLVVLLYCNKKYKNKIDNNELTLG